MQWRRTAGPGGGVQILYGHDMPLKQRPGLQLARTPENLEPLLENEQLLGLLARVLQEEGPKSMDLAINILYILYSFSNFSQFHPALYNAKVGANVLQAALRGSCATESGT